VSRCSILFRNFLDMVRLAKSLVPQEEDPEHTGDELPLPDSPDENVTFRSRSSIRWAGAAVALATILLCCPAVLLARDRQREVEVPSLQVANELGAQELMDLFALKEEMLGGMGHANASLVKDLFRIQRNLQHMTQNPLALPIATCTVDVYLVASFIGIIGNVVNGAVNACERRDKTRGFVKADRFADILKIDLLDEPKRQALLSVLDTGCRIGIETSVALFSFTAAFLARAASDCAISMKLPANPGAGCAADLALLPSAVSYLAAGADTVKAVCPPYPHLVSPEADTEFANVNALDIVGGLSRRLGIQDAVRKQKLEQSKDDVRQIIISRLPSIGPVGGFILNNAEWLKIRRQMRKDKARTEKEVKCGFDVAGTVGFAAAAGVFITAGTLECPLASADGDAAEGFKMGCSLDVSAVIAALTTIGGFIGILATECPEEPQNAAAKLCATGSLNIVSSLGFLSAAFSDVKRTCGAAQ